MKLTDSKNALGKKSGAELKTELEALLNQPLTNFIGAELVALRRWVERTVCLTVGDAPLSVRSKRAERRFWLMPRRYGHCSTKNIKKLVCKIFPRMRS